MENLEFKGTKGEWVLRQFVLGQMSVRTKDDTRKIFVSRVNNFEESEANMKLGAASKDLLEALRDLVSAIDSEKVILAEEYENAKKAIEKALK